MKIPASIKLLGHRIKIKPVENLERHHHAMGMYVPAKKTILIDAHLDAEDILPTLIHELGHALFSLISINQAVSNDIEEIIVDNYANMIDALFHCKLK